jgi:hypothetical protein
MITWLSPHARPGMIATKIVEDLRAALAQFEEIESDLKD